jgi:hypothetical protein
MPATPNAVAPTASDITTIINLKRVIQSSLSLDFTIRLS